MAKNKLNKSWLHDHINDPYVKLAQKEGYRARAAYKLKEIDEDERLIKPGQIIVDLGCAPGSWCQYVRRKLAGKEGGGIHGMIVGRCRSGSRSSRQRWRGRRLIWCSLIWRLICPVLQRRTPRGSRT